MPKSKPETLAEYLAWAQETSGADWGDKTKTWYEIITTGGVNLLNTKSEALNAFRKSVANSCEVFQSTTQLDASNSDPKSIAVVVKPYESLIEKTYRINVINNRHWPDPPRDGWIVPKNVFSTINDIFRGEFVCNYLDLAESIANEGAAAMKAAGVSKSTASPQGRETGYHAYHVNFSQSIPYIAIGSGDAGDTMVNIEIQIRTKLQSVLYELTHLVYEKNRVQGSLARGWQWDLKAPEYKSAYLGHTLHLIEGVLIELRDSLTSHDNGTAKDNLDD